MKITPQQIVAARKASGLTQTQAAVMIGGTLRAWQEWEGGRRNMPPAKYNLFLIVTGVTPPALAG
jgi:DNA-binding transcriptional regulator YiaG